MDVLDDRPTWLDQVRFQSWLGWSASHGAVSQSDGSTTAGDKLVPAAGSGASLNASTHNGSTDWATNDKGAGAPDVGGPGHGT